MTAFDWYFYRENGTGLTELVHIEPSSTNFIAAEYRFVYGEALSNINSQPNLVFRTVNGKLTCADKALYTPGEFPLPQLKAFLKVTNRLADSKPRLRPNTDWNTFRRRVAIINPSDTFAAREATIEILGAQPDYRVGLASLVAGHEGLGMDALVTNTTKLENIAERVIGELLEIACLNILYKPTTKDGLIDIVKNLLSLVSDPAEIRRTWSAHLLRTLDLNGRQWRAQVDAIDLAESVLDNIWTQSADSFDKKKNYDEG